MHALYRLQNASGLPGLTARSVVLPKEGLKKREAAKNEVRLDRREQWRPTPDGDLYWKSDTSSDEYCGHHMAFYTYWEHIAQHDQVALPVEHLLRDRFELDLTAPAIDVR